MPDTLEGLYLKIIVKYTDFTTHIPEDVAVNLIRKKIIKNYQEAEVCILTGDVIGFSFAAYTLLLLFQTAFAT